METKLPAKRVSFRAHEIFCFRASATNIWKSVRSDEIVPPLEISNEWGIMHWMDELTIRRAQKLMKLGLEAVLHGDVKFARENFKASANEYPTADAMTYWGWMEHHLGNTAIAIELCEKAIALDPEFGNPYNDIGSYLVSLGKEEDAISWLEKAKSAKRYEPRQFPYINLGRIYLSKNMHVRALREFEAALQISPDDHSVAEMVQRLRLSIN